MRIIGHRAVGGRKDRAGRYRRRGRGSSGGVGELGVGLSEGASGKHGVVGPSTPAPYFRAVQGFLSLRALETRECR